MIQRFRRDAQRSAWDIFPAAPLRVAAKRYSFETIGMAFRLLPTRNAVGWHYAVRIFLGTALVLLMGRLAGFDPLWAVITVIVVTEPWLKSAWLAFVSRCLNTLIGCGTGLVFLLLVGPEQWLLPPAVALTVLLCTYLRIPLSWRIGPVTTALVLASGVGAHSVAPGLQTALLRTGQVLLGSAVALLVTYCLGLVWAHKDPPAAKVEPPPDHAGSA